MTLGSHQTTLGKSQTHLTPRWILKPLGLFDLDPCAAEKRPWDCATKNLTEQDDGLAHLWSGRVWLNPPFDRYVVAKWMDRFLSHGDGIALIHARTETGWFLPVWRRADAILFLGSRVKFCTTDGIEQPDNSGAPVVLVAVGAQNVVALKRSGLPGALVTVWHEQQNFEHPHKRSEGK